MPLKKDKVSLGAHWLGTTTALAMPSQKNTVKGLIVLSKKPRSQ